MGPMHVKKELDLSQAEVHSTEIGKRTFPNRLVGEVMIVVTVVACL